MTQLQQLAASQVSPEVPLNENFEALSATAIFAKRPAATSGLTWGYYGGLFNGNTIADDTVTLTDDADNYIVVARATGIVSASTATTNWDNTAAYARLYKVTAADGGASAIVDHRMDDGGLLAGATGGGGGSTIGVHMIPIMAAAMVPSASGGCAALAVAATSANRPDLHYLAFDASTQEYAQFAVPMPESWDGGTITAKFVWSHGSTATDFSVVWGLQAVAVGDDDTINVDYGTAQAVTDTGGTTNDLYISGATAAITVGGTPAGGKTVFFRVSRVATDGSDTLAVDARLHSVRLYIVTDAETDA